MNVGKTVVKTWIIGTAAIFGVLIVGFLAWTVFKSVIQPRTAALSACTFESGCLYTVVNGSSSVRVVGFSPDGTQLITRGSSTLVHDAATGDRLYRLDPEFDSFSAEFMGSTPETAAIGRERIEFFDRDGELLRTWRADPDERTAEFAALPIVDGFALAQADGIAFYAMADGGQFTQLPDSQAMSQLTTSHDGALLAAYSAATDTIHIWPLEHIDDAITIREAGGIADLQLSADGALLVARNDSGAFVWQTADGALVGSVQNPEFVATAVDLADSGTHLAVGYDDGFVEVWAVPQGELLQQFEHGRQLSGIALSPDGSQLAVGLRKEAVVTRITPEERWEAQQRAARGQPDSVERFLSPNTNYIDTNPGYAIVWSVEG